MASSGTHRNSDSRWGSPITPSAVTPIISSAPFLVRRLPPLHANINKRLTKSPKLYWRDSGLLHALLGATTTDALLNAPWVGASWEGFVIEQAISCLTQRGVDPDPHFFRTSDGREIDLILTVGRERWAIEVKLTSAPSEKDLAQLDSVADLVGAERRILVSRIERIADGGRRVSANLPWLIDALVSAASPQHARHRRRTVR